MQPKLSSYIPRKIKRFQSYSMTPMDSYWDNQNNLQNTSFTSYNKFNASKQTDQLERNITENKRNTENNQISFKSNSKYSAPNSFTIQNSFKKGIQISNQQNNQTLIRNNAFSRHYNKKLSCSNIYDFSSIEQKKTFMKEKTMKHSMLLPNRQDQIFTQDMPIQNDCDKNQIKRKQVKIPSFLLGKKKKPQMNPSPFSQSTINQVDIMNQQINNQPFSVAKKLSFKKQKAMESEKTMESEQNKSLFSPPSISKISFSKATSSTFCSNLQREASQSTLKDFDEDYNTRLTNSVTVIQKNQNEYSLQNEVDELFKPQENQMKRRNTLESQIAQLFSDEQQQNEQFNEQILHEFQKLF